MNDKEFIKDYIDRYKKSLIETDISNEIIELKQLLLDVKKRNNKVSEYKSKNRITSLFNKQENTQNFPDGLIILDVSFYGPDKIFTFACYIHSPDDVEYSLTIYENKYNKWIQEKMNK